MRIIFYFTLLSLLAYSALSAPLLLDAGKTQISIHSTLEEDDVELMMKIKAHVGTRISFYSQALSPQVGSHTFTMTNQDIEVDPSMADETLIFNNAHEGWYWMAFNHKFEGDLLHFLPIEITKDEETYQMLLPTFQYPVEFLSESSFYRCDNILLSVENNKNQLQINIFSRVQKEKWSLEGGKWHESWSHTDRGIVFGSSKRHDLASKVTLSVSNDQQCSFYPQELEKSEKVLDPKKYYTMRDIEEWAPRLKMDQKFLDQL